MFEEDPICCTNCYIYLSNLRSVVRGGFPTGKFTLGIQKQLFIICDKQIFFFWSTDRINTLAISQLGLTRKSQLSRSKQSLLCRQFLTHQALKYRRFSQQFNPYSWSSTMEYQQLFSVQYTISFIIPHHHMFPLRRCQSPQFLLHSPTKPWRPKRLR